MGSDELEAEGTAHLVVVEDDRSQAALIRRWLEEAGYRVTLYADGQGCLQGLAREPADAVILDMHLPTVNGLEVLRQLRAALTPETYLPILMLTSDDSPVARERALSLGASDFLSKPITRPELLLRMRNHLRLRGLSADLSSRNRTLSDQLSTVTQELDQAHLELLERLARAAELRDDATGQHGHRVASVAGAIARAMGLSDQEATLIERAAPLHDIGKIGIPDVILLKPGRLTPVETAVMDTHTTLGAQILGGSSVPVLAAAAEISATHHERWDGAGPLGLAGDAIPLAGRIVCASDVLDALTHERSYKPAWPLSDAIAEIRRESGIRFDPAVVDALLRVLFVTDQPRAEFLLQLPAETPAHVSG